MKKLRFLTQLVVVTLYLGLSNGHLAIFNQSDPQPLHILPYDAKMFCDTDRAQLKQGIPFSTAAELSRLLEDYTS